MIAPAAGGIAHALHFELGDERAASTPPEARGLARDEVRLLVAEGASIEHAQFRALHRLLRAGDLLVVNTTATLPAAVDAQRTGGRVASVHFSTALDDGTWIVEVRPAAHATGPVDDAAPGERLLLPGDVALTLLWPYPDAAAARPRLWRARLSRGEVADVLRRHGRPITYAYVTGEWPLEYYQTVFARHPGSAEMPSAARPFSDRLATALISAGVAFAPVLLHTGVSSLETGEAPLAEPFHVPASSAARVNATRTAGGRIIAVGTTSARALESATDARGMVVPRRGWTDLVLGPDRAARVLDGLITGWHAPGASHLHLLEAVVGPELVQHAYQEALFAGYLWHEFGDSCLLLR